jgi:V/A-type H+-transporting ATPase subunit I
MSLIGGLLWAKHLKRPTGMSRLAGAFALGGLFAIMWGALFNSFFGFMILPSTVMPNPQTDMWLLAGIKVPSVLIIAMELGIFQIFVGYICKAWQHFRRGEVLDGIFSGVLWAIFSVGLALAIVGFVEEANLPFLATYGGITAGVSLGLAVITAGWKEKFFGKFTKGFGAAYGVINYASDILSYARLYGLMLSGAVIAQIIATYGGGFIVSGNILLVILGVVIMLVGHAFNLVMNLLGAYIHDARLQYVEFYGRFFEGEGELFAPLGSSQKYVYLLRKE